MIDVAHSIGLSDARLYKMAGNAVTVNVVEAIVIKLRIASKGKNLRLLMKNVAGIFADSAEENFKNEGRLDKWTDLAEIAKEK